MNSFVRAWVFLTMIALAASPAWGAIFSDIQGLPAQRAIERLAAKGIIRSSSDKFNPSGNVTRADLAIFLSRASGLGDQNLSTPDIKDWNEVSKEAQQAVAIMASMGTVSPRTAEMKKGVLLYSLVADKPVYGPGERITLRFAVENQGKEDARFEYSSDLHFDFIVRDGTGNEMARRSLGIPVRQVEMSGVLVAGKKIEFGAVWWFQRDQNDAQVPPGRYEIVAMHLTKSNPTNVSLVYNKGLMTLFPDGTFRPKAELSRSELAVTIVKALGLAEGSQAALQGITDANEIPPSVRGAVAAAVEKKLLLVSADRTLRPNRPATRADVAFALDALMEALKRYDFSKGTLKDLRVGNPTIIQIEDEQKALRTYRVARAHAVYRNNVAVELKDIKAGDQLQFLKAGDVGDVAYIEATAR